MLRLCAGRNSGAHCSWRKGSSGLPPFSGRT
nr:MAG TPA: hypothetical protein [Caudoviricetes sp.]DAQ01367.1 MAG TPA: hypothetical protein [Caudoviricetes sp.]